MDTIAFIDGANTHAAFVSIQKAANWKNLEDWLRSKGWNPLALYYYSTVLYDD